MGLPPVLVYQPVNELGQPPRRGIRDILSEQNAPDTGRRGKELYRHREKYLHQPKIESPEIIVVTADIPTPSLADLFKGQSSVLLVGQQEIR